MAAPVYRRPAMRLKSAPFFVSAGEKASLTAELQAFKFKSHL